MTACGAVGIGISRLPDLHGTRAVHCAHAERVGAMLQRPVLGQMTRANGPRIGVSMQASTQG